MLLLNGWISIGQTVLSDEPDAQLLTKIPFRYFSGGVMVIQATLNDGKDSLNFILDTGSGGISLDSTTCAQNKIQSIKTDTIITGLGNARKVSFAYGQQLHLSGLDLPKLNFHINDYDILTSVYGEKIDGIIGYSFFNRYIVKIDGDSNHLEVYSLGNFKYPHRGMLLHPAFSTLAMQNLTVKDGREVNFNFFLDTGAGLCFLMSDSFAKDSAILHKKRKPILTQGEGMSGRIKMSLTVVKKLKVGKYVFRNVPSFIFEDKYNVTSYPFVGGLLGNDILRRFNVILNYRNHEVHLQPNSHFAEPFDYAYTGMSMYMQNGNIMIDDIIANSPAEKAGIKEDDILVAVGSSFSNNIMQYKSILQNANAKIPLIVRRNDQLIKLHIKPLSIL